MLKYNCQDRLCYAAVTNDFKISMEYIEFFFIVHTSCPLKISCNSYLYLPHCETQAVRPLGNFANFMAEGKGHGTMN